MVVHCKSLLGVAASKSKHRSHAHFIGYLFHSVMEGSCRQSGDSGLQGKYNHYIQPCTVILREPYWGHNISYNDILLCMQWECVR